jgi:phenylacetate-CoA ligase
MRRGDSLLAFGGGTMPDLKAAAKTAGWDGLRKWIRIPPQEGGYTAFLSHHRLIEQFRPRFIYGPGSTIHQLARFYSEETLEPPPWLRGIFFTGGRLPDSWRRVVMQAFEAPAICEYGSAEAGAFAFECREGGVHLASENVHLEILRDGKPAAEGEEGEIVVTVLQNRAMPLIRYNLEDRARLLPGRCPCGRYLPRLELTNTMASDLVQAFRGSTSR